jgi:hypothetical protein
MLPPVLPPDPPRLPPVLPPEVRRAEEPPAPGPAPVATVTYLVNGRLVVVPVGQPLPPGLFSPAPRLMPRWCPPGRP